MEFAGNYFEYSGVSSRQYKLIFANVNTERNICLAGNIQPNNMFNKMNNRNYQVGYEYRDAAMEMDAEIVTEDGSCMDDATQRNVEKWLFHRSGYRKLYIDPTCGEDDTTETINGEKKRLYLNCIMLNPERIEGNGGIVGYKFTIVCDSAMAWQDNVSLRYSLGGGSSSTITVNVNTDLEDYIYPKVTIKTSGSDLQIVNQTDSSSRITSFTGLTSGIEFIMNGNGVNYISGDNYLKFKDRNFVRLLDGSNKLSISGASSITLEFQNRRYI